MMKETNTILIVGLGNPGEQYARSPHNAGFLVIDQLIADYELRITDYEKLKAEIAEIKLDNKKIILSKPQTFMNKSGEAAKLLNIKYQISNTNFWLIHDDIDLELGKIKIVKNRGSAGHRGVEDIIQRIGTKNFLRFRIGVRPPRLPQKRSQALMNKFVTAKLSPEENKILEQAIKRCKDAVIMALENGIEKAMSAYNAK